ncbi:MAG: uncharacterized protein PWR10_2345 [Halanaerobiales bacterium]|nr:uncharacterized protein [Halanaerobiales bacterium]
MQIFILCIAGFIAAVFDSIAGGGGIITIPAFLALGIPPHFTLGTNKFAASWGSFTSTLTFLRSGKIYLPLIKYIIPFTFLGASLGVNTALRINQKYLQVIVLVMLAFVSIYTILKKDIGKDDSFEGLDRKKIITGSVIGFILGFYDGFFGPGTGSFLLFAFAHFFGFNFTRSTANARILNFTSNFTSLLLFAINGKIIYALGIPMAISMVLGARLGSKIAIKQGGKIIKPIFVTMTLLVVIKLFFDTFYG